MTGQERIRTVVDLLAEPEKVEKLRDDLMEKHLAILEKMCASVGDGHVRRCGGIQRLIPFNSPAKLFIRRGSHG